MSFVKRVWHWRAHIIADRLLVLYHHLIVVKLERRFVLHFLALLDDVFCSLHQQIIANYVSPHKAAVHIFF